MAGINRKFFFDQARQSLFNGKLNQKQVNGLNFILDVWEAEHANKDDRWLAYALGTAHHEVAATMQPIHEFGSAQRFFRLYDKDGQRPQVAKALGNTQAGDGVLFHGRGYVQLTGRANYRKMQNKFGVDLTSNTQAANRVLQPAIAAKIMFYGMERGIFTGKKFADYFKASKQDWINARRIINRLDRAKLIAGYAQRYYAAISYTK